MTYDEAMSLADEHLAMIRRPEWGGYQAVRFREMPRMPEVDDWTLVWVPFLMELDNSEGSGTGNGTPYEPTPEDKAANDWQIYDAGLALPSRKTVGQAFTDAIRKASEEGGFDVRFEGKPKP